MKIAIATTFALAAAQEKKVRSRYNKVLIFVEHEEFMHMLHSKQVMHCKVCIF